ncbi:MAG: hypothetical protein WKF77_26075 [Planctomycetaceae bacterium]
MPRFHDDSNDEFQDDDDVYSEFDDQSDMEDEQTVVCSNCGFEMLEIAYQCPRCGEIPSREFARTTTHPRWVIFTALMLLGLLLWWILSS